MYGKVCAFTCIFLTAACVSVPVDETALNYNPGIKREGGNSPPSVIAPSSQSMYYGSTLGALSFSVSDSETDASALSVTVTTNNSTVLPSSGISLSGSGSQRTITLTPTLSLTSGDRYLTNVAVSAGTLTLNHGLVVVGFGE